MTHGVVVSVSQTLRIEHRAPSIFGRAAITLGIGPHSSDMVLWLGPPLTTVQYFRFCG